MNNTYIIAIDAVNFKNPSEVANKISGGSYKSTKEVLEAANSQLVLEDGETGEVKILTLVDFIEDCNYNLIDTDGNVFAHVQIKQ